MTAPSMKIETPTQAPLQDCVPVVDFMGLPLAKLTVQEFTEWMLATAMKRRSRLPGNACENADDHPVVVTYLNAWCSLIAEHDTQYRELIKKGDCLYADGMAIVWASRLFRAPVPERVNAGDFILDFCRLCAAGKLSIHLVGGKQGVAERAARCWSTHAPGLKITGYDPGYFASVEDERKVLDRINQARPDFLIVGMGVPQQEKWIASHVNELDCGICWSVGALFEYFGAARPRAPIWVRQIGMEWAFRLALEPRRLASRYLIGNVRFAYNVLKHRSRMKTT